VDAGVPRRGRLDSEVAGMITEIGDEIAGMAGAGLDPSLRRIPEDQIYRSVLVLDPPLGPTHAPNDLGELGPGRVRHEDLVANPAEEGLLDQVGRGSGSWRRRSDSRREPRACVP
jgi:hypothetical protein